jgi:hypothetical protein
MQSEWAAKIFGDKEDPRVRLQSGFGGDVPESGQPPRAALEWASVVLEGVPAERRDTVNVTRALRQKEPRLTLRSAIFLADHAISRS